MSATLRRRPAAEPRRTLPPSLPVNGFAMTRRWITDQARTIEEIHDIYGDIASIKFAGGRGGIITRAPADIEKIFRAPPEEVPSATGGSPIGPFVGEHSLLTLNGRRHLRHRRLLLPPFHGDRMRGYADDIQAIAAAEIATWHPGTTMPLQPRMQSITLEVILRIVFGVEDTARQDDLRAAIVKLLAYTENKWIMGPSFIAAIRMGRLVGPVATVAKEVDRLIYAEIALRRKDPDLESRPDVLSMLLTAVDEDGEPMGEQELRDELVTLLFAGHETTASALSWTFERLVREPEAMAAATAAAEGDDPDGLLDATFQETLRLRPVVPLTARLLAAPMELSGYELEVGDLVIVSILGACRHPDRYDDPLAFDPGRYLGGTKPDPFAWIPFGGGVRRCIGAAFANLEGRMVMREILRRTQLEAVDPADEGLRRRNVTIVPSQGALVNVIRVDR
ncbi:MAG: cytochrome P450 [Solirubrobacteraceae bacterium]|nr:cytochrome P450 [Solirubrobacteraceae bacterium]